jgi:hypothetical protein
MTCVSRPRRSNAARITSECSSHSLVDPSMSVNRKVTVPMVRSFPPGQPAIERRGGTQVNGLSQAEEFPVRSVPSAIESRFDTNRYHAFIGFDLTPAGLAALMRPSA